MFKSKYFLLIGIIVLLALTACGSTEQPVAEPTQPVAEPTQPAAEPTQPAAEPTQPAAEPTQPAAEPTQPAASTDVRSDIPLPTDATNVVSTGNEIVFDTNLSVTAVAEFLKTEMPKLGWEIDEAVSVVTDMAGALIFSKSDATAEIALAPMGSGSRVTIVVTGGEETNLTTAPVVAEPTLPAATQATATPAQATTSDNTIPLPADATSVVSTDSTITFDTKLSIVNAAEFLKTEMPNYGWKLDEMVSIITDLAGALIFSKGSAMAEIALTPMGSGTRVTMVITGGEGEFTPLPVSAEPTTTSSSGSGSTSEATAVPSTPSDIPIPDDATAIVSTGTEITFNTGLSISGTNDFFRAQMPNYSWQIDEDVSVVTDLAGALIFSKGSAMAEIALAPMGTGTRVTIVITR